MKLYFAQVKDSTDTLMIDGETLLVSNPTILALIMELAGGKDLAKNHTIKSVEAGIVRTEGEQRESLRGTMRKVLTSMENLAKEKK